MFSPPHCKLVITLQSCDKVTHVNLIIFILTKTQRKSIGVRISTFTRKSPCFRFQEKKQCKLGVLSIGGMKCLVGKKAH